MIMSSIDLFFSRDWAGGRGPAAEPPRFTFTALVPSFVAVLGGCVAACEVLDGAVDFAKLNKFELGAGAGVDAFDVLVASELGSEALSCAFPMLENRLLAEAMVEGADVPELLGGLLKKPKVPGAAVGDDTGLLVDDWG